MTDTPAVLVVVTTTDSAQHADELAAAAVAVRLAACSQISAPITSCYRWQGEVRRDQEWQVQFKTTAARYPELEDFLRERHSYDEPEIIATEVVHGSTGYLRWVAAETAPEVDL